METQVRTPQMVFMQPQRLIVPLFQRPYVWNEDNQWEPLWGDVVRVAQRLLDDPAPGITLTSLARSCSSRCRIQPGRCRNGRSLTGSSG